jgi:hypothetical protein
MSLMEEQYRLHEAMQGSWRLLDNIYNQVSGRQELQILLPR